MNKFFSEKTLFKTFKKGKGEIKVSKSNNFSQKSLTIQNQTILSEKNKLHTQFLTFNTEYSNNQSNNEITLDYHFFKSLNNK
jgi:hypothetical protein